MQKIGSFRKNTALRLFDVIPAEWGYRGNLHTCLLEDIRRPLADETKEEPSPEEKPEEEGGLPSDFTEYREIAKQFEAQEPRFTFERLVLSDEVRSQLDASIAILENREKLFEQWGLKAIMSPSVLLNLYGSSGTGKDHGGGGHRSPAGEKDHPGFLRGHREQVPRGGSQTAEGNFSGGPAAGRGAVYR